MLLAALLGIVPGCAGADGSYLQIVVRQYGADSAAVPASVKRALAEPPGRQVRDASGRVWAATGRGLREHGPRGDRLWLGADGLPILELTGIALGGERDSGGSRPAPSRGDALASDGSSRAPALPVSNSESLWIATAKGAILFRPDVDPEARWYYFAGKRYLPDDNVHALAADSTGAWIRTGTGLARIEFRPYTLAEKASVFEDRIARRHWSVGYVRDCEMPAAGDLKHCRPVPTDNDGLWTAIYVAAECYRYAATASSDALAQARASLEAMLRLETVTGIPGFPARAIAAPGEPRDPGGEWHPAGDGSFWKGDTSSDELVGHFFADWVAWNLLPAGDPSRRRAAAEASRIAEGLVDHGLKLVGPGGKMTRWGDYTPEYFKTQEGAEDAPLDSLEILSHLKVAERVSGKPELDAAYARVALKLGYLQNVAGLAPAPVEVNYSDEELAELAFVPVILPVTKARAGVTWAEPDSILRARYLRAFEGFSRRVREEKNPLWEIIAAASTDRREGDLASAIDELERIPLDTMNWSLPNAGRADLAVRPRLNRFDRPQAARAIPPNERQVMKWNGDPFEIQSSADGPGGRTEDDGAFFLLPYWMGRYYRLLPP